MWELGSNLDQDLHKIEASMDRDRALPEAGTIGMSMESDSQWEIVDSPETKLSTEQPLSEFMEDVLRDQEEAIELSPCYPQVLLKLLQLVARADGYRQRLGKILAQNPELEEGLAQLEQSSERVRTYVEGTDLEEQEPIIMDDHPLGLTSQLYSVSLIRCTTGSWGHVEMGQCPGSSKDELETTIEDYVTAMGFFWDAVDQALWR